MAISSTFVVTAPLGFHANSITKIADEARKYQSEINLIYNNKSVSMKSMMGAVSLGIPANAKCQLVIEGPDEEIVLEKIEKVLRQTEMID